jgi:peptidoglycan biosynthesis protein MviN/MurJ (putative lipid II flippase)
MDAAQWRTSFARLMLTGALACGLVGLVIGVVDRTWKLGVTGWFTGGTLLALIAIGLLVDETMRRRSSQ